MTSTELSARCLTSGQAQRSPFFPFWVCTPCSISTCSSSMKQGLISKGDICMLGGLVGREKLSSVGRGWLSFLSAGLSARGGVAMFWTLGQSGGCELRWVRGSG